MKTYAIADLHGYPLDKFLKLLDKAGFTEDDTLYILGDVIDRNGDGGVELLRYIMDQPNFEFILGNHEQMLLDCDFLFNDISEENIKNLTELQMDCMNDYLANGGGVTLKSLFKLSHEEPEAIGDILDFLRESPLIGAETVGERDFLFVHAGLGNFSPSKKLSEYTEDEVLWERPELDTRYFDDMTTVFGHTPTLCYGEEHAGKIIVTPTWINIDAGAASGYEPALLRLDDMQVFYGE